MNFLFDHNCNPKLIGVVMGLVAGHTFEDLRTTYPDAKDEVWIPAISRRPEPWVVVSGDKARFTKRTELVLLKQHPLTWVGLMGTYVQAQFEEQARRLAEVWPRLVRKVEAQHEPWVYKIKQDPRRKQGAVTHRIVVERYKPIRDL